MFPYEFWTRYLDEFESVKIIARVQEGADADPGWKRVDGPGVGFFPLPDYRGPVGYARRRQELKRRLNACIRMDDALIMRVASPIAGLALEASGVAGRPFGLEVVGDPWDVFAPGAVRHPLRALFRWHFARQLRDQCRQAAAVAYVTKDALQRRYPASARAFKTHYSSIRLLDQDYVEDAVVHSRDPGVLVSVGTMSQMYKGFDTLVQSVRICVSRGRRLVLHLVGDGSFRARLAKMIADLDLTQHVILHGQVTSGAEVHAILDRADVFVLASRQEGVPRAMIEAMARGLPCLGTTVGGIPELLAADCLVPPNDPCALAAAIERLLASPNLRLRLGQANLARARDYHEDVLGARRREFYRTIRAATQAGISGRQRP